MPTADSGERNGGDAEIGGDVVLRNPPYDVGMLFEQLLVALPRRVLDAREKKQLVGAEPLDEFLFIYPSQRRRALDQVVKIIPLHDRHLRGFDTLQRKEARQPFVQAVERRDEIAFEEELKGNVFPVVAEKQPQTAFANQVEFVGHLALFEQKRFGGHGQSLGQGVYPFQNGAFVGRKRLVGRAEPIGQRLLCHDYFRYSVGLRPRFC